MNPLTPPAQPDPRHPENRRLVRYLCGLETQGHLTAAIEGTPWPVQVRNISTGGICLVADHRLEPGSPMVLNLHNAAHHFACQVPAQVVYVLENPGGLYLLGCAFTREFSDGEIQGLL